MSRYVPFFCLALQFSACHSVTRRPAPSDTRKHDGQMVYQTARNSIVGDVILRPQPTGDYDLIFSKGGAQMLQIQAHDGHLVATGLFARNGWTGPVDRTPGPLRAWALLKKVVPSFNSKQAVAP